MLFVSFLFFIGFVSGFQDESDGYQVTQVKEVKAVTPSGVFLGSWMQTRRGRNIRAFRGVRYAEPPVGELRFQPPRLISIYTEEVNATLEGPACPMPVAPSNFKVIDEDCLRLNVYSPESSKSSSKLPVIVFMHPGGFYSFSGRSVVFGPDYLLDRDVVLVVINYRLGSLGFLSTGDKLAPGNNGFKDQVAALRWIQRNIAAFGGDPSKVTIAGCSAGSASVMLHMVSPMSKGLFHRAISMSGSSISKRPLRTEFKDLAVRQAELMQCPTNDFQTIIDCLKTKPYIDLGNSVNGLFKFGSDPIRLWDAVVEQDFGQERFMTEQPADVIRSGRMNSVPFIVSQNRDEFFWKAFTVLNNATLLKQLNENFEDVAPIAFMLPDNNSKEAARYLKEKYLDGKQLANDNESAEKLGKLYRDAITGFPVHRLANIMCRNSKNPVYYANFDYVGNNSFYQSPESGKPLGVAHQDDLLYLFGIRYRFPIIPESDTNDSKMVDRMTAIWYNFARFGNPNPQRDTPEIKDLSWPVMTADKRQYLNLGLQFSIKERLLEDRFQIWENLYPMSYEPKVNVV